MANLLFVQWREMPKPEKVVFEEKAKRVAEEQAAKQEAADKAFNDSLSMYPPSHSPAPDRSMSPAAHGRPLVPGAHPQHYQQGRLTQTHTHTYKIIPSRPFKKAKKAKNIKCIKLLWDFI